MMEPDEEPETHGRELAAEDLAYLEDPAYPIMQDERLAHYCEVCDVWLNGVTDWQDHQLERKHRKKTFRMTWLKVRNAISGEELACRAAGVSKLRKFIQNTVMTNNPESVRLEEPGWRPEIQLMCGTRVLGNCSRLDDFVNPGEELSDLVIDYLVLPK